jgi:hypothetical protein
MPDNPELDRHWAGDPGTLRTIPARAQRSHCAIHGGSQGAQAVQRGVRNVIEAQTEAVRTLTAKVNQVLPVVSDMPPRSMS